MKVSIVMPVYNSEEYLSKAVDSVLAQDFDGFELILVDDGSPDGSGAICDDYAARFNNVKVVHKENGGICSARNAGLDVAEGEYIGFCDNDDEYLPGLIKDNYTYAKEHNVDLMRYAKIKRLERDDGKSWTTIAKIEDMCISKDEFAAHYDNIRREDTLWTAFYKRSIIEDHHIRFDTRFKYGSEDMNFNLVFLKYCEVLGFNSKAYYSWTQRDSHSTSRKFKRDFLKEILVNLQLEYEFMQDTCEGKVDNKMKNVFLTNSYIHTVLDYMDNKSCDMTKADKCKYLNHMRNHPIFDKELPKETSSQVFKENKRLYLTMKFFYTRRFSALIDIVSGGRKVLAKFRFKA